MPYFQPRIVSERCDRCGDCIPACPRGLIRMAERWQINWLDCDDCEACVRVCKREAICVAPLVPGAARPGEVLLFEQPAPGNLLLAIQAVIGRAARGGLDAVVVASLSGSTAVLLARALEGVALPLICVADTPEWIACGHPYPTLDDRHRQELLARGARILRDYPSSSAGTPRFDADAGGDVPLSATEAALFWDGVSAVGGEGLKTAVKSVVLATDHALLRRGDRVVSLGGTGGSEAAVVMEAIAHADILSGAPGTRLRVHEILCLPGA